MCDGCLRQKVWHGFIPHCGIHMFGGRIRHGGINIVGGRTSSTYHVNIMLNLVWVKRDVTFSLTNCFGDWHCTLSLGEFYLYVYIVLSFFV